MFFQKLYVRIWLAVVGTVAVLTLLVTTRLMRTEAQR